jgi:hypothetical protein
LANLPNQNGVDAEPIPDIRTDIRTDTKENITKETSCDEPFDTEKSSRAEKKRGSAQPPAVLTSVISSGCFL